MKIEAALIVLPLIVSLIYNEACSKDFVVSIVIALVAGFALTLISRPGNKVIYAKEGFVVVALAWITMSLVGAIPFMVSGVLPSFFDAFF